MKYFMKLCICCSKPISSLEKKFCNRSCAARFNNVGTKRNFNPNKKSTRSRKQFRDDQDELHYQRFLRGEVSDRFYLRKFLLKTVEKKCSCCFLSEWQGQEIPLELDHIDNDPSNNHPSNLRLLCRNCHGLTPLFGSKNRGNGRKSRGISLG